MTVSLDFNLRGTPVAHPVYGSGVCTGHIHIVNGHTFRLFSFDREHVMLHSGVEREGCEANSCWWASEEAFGRYVVSSGLDNV